MSTITPEHVWELARQLSPLEQRWLSVQLQTHIAATLPDHATLGEAIVSAAIDVVLATPEQLPARIAVLEEALKKNDKAAEALAAARSALAPVEWTERIIATCY